MGKVVHDALNREIGFILAGRQRAPDNRHDCDSLRISVQTAEYALGMIDRLAAATGGRSNRLVRKMRHVRATFAKDFTIEAERLRPQQDAVGEQQPTDGNFTGFDDVAADGSDNKNPLPNVAEARDGITA